MNQPLHTIRSSVDKLLTSQKNSFDISAKNRRVERSVTKCEMRKHCFENKVNMTSHTYPAHYLYFVVFFFTFLLVMLKVSRFLSLEIFPPEAKF